MDVMDFLNQFQCLRIKQLGTNEFHFFTWAGMLSSTKYRKEIDRFEEIIEYFKKYGTINRPTKVEFKIIFNDPNEAILFKLKYL